MLFRLILRLRRNSLIVLGLVLAAAPATAQVAGDVPAELEEVGVDEHLDETIPLDLEFTDERGRTVQLGDYFRGDRPVILSLNYYRCPMLCGLQLNGLVDGLADLEWTPGVEFEVVTVSIDPTEKPTLARQKKQSYLKRIGRPAAAGGWHFLTGKPAEIRALAEATGFRYAKDETTGEYAHAAVLFVLTPEGRLARYLYGIEMPRKTLRLSLVEASEGKIGSALDQLILYCYHYDPSSRSYAPVAMNIMRAGGGASALLLGVVLSVLWLREARRRRGGDREPTET